MLGLQPKKIQSSLPQNPIRTPQQPPTAPIPIYSLGLEPQRSHRMETMNQHAAGGWLDLDPLTRRPWNVMAWTYGRAVWQKRRWHKLCMLEVLGFLQANSLFAGRKKQLGKDQLFGSHAKEWKRRSGPAAPNWILFLQVVKGNCSFRPPR